MRTAASTGIISASCFLAAFALVCLPVAMSQESGSFYPRKFAICVGIDNYKGEFPELYSAAKDARDMADKMRDLGFDVLILLDGEATRQAIENAVQRIRGKAGFEDLIVFYFAGHGITGGEEGQEEGFLVTYDCRSPERIDDALPMSFLADLASIGTTKQMLFLIDACYSGLALTRGMSTRPTTQRRMDYFRKLLSTATNPCS